MAQLEIRLELWMQREVLTEISQRMTGFPERKIALSVS